MSKQGQWALVIARQIRGSLPAHISAPYARPIPEAQQLVPLSIVAAADRTYITRIAEQINRTYADGCFDACLVMVRKLLETLVIEVYERRERATDIQDEGGEFLRLEALVNVICADKTINLSRGSKKALRDAKEIGDQSAHSRRFCAREADVSRHRDGLRLIVEELCRLAA